VLPKQRVMIFIPDSPTSSS